MARIWWFLAVLAVSFVLAGCYNQAARTTERRELLMSEWVLAHPGEKATPEVQAQIAAKAMEEEKAARSKELAGAGKDVVNGGFKLATGDYVGGGILIIGAGLTWLGLRRKPADAPAKEGEPV